MSLSPRMCCAVLAATLLASLPASSAPTRVPPGHDESGQRERREEWLESIHRAAPGTDWRLIEAANREQVRLELGGIGMAASASWSERGADGTTGRNQVAAAGRFDPSVLYVGSALGGLWSGAVHGGPTWTPRTDALGLGVHDIVVIPRADRDDFLITDGSKLTFFTANGGATWSAATGFPAGSWGPQRVVQDAANPLRIYAMVQNWYWNGLNWEMHNVVCRSVNGGASFTPVHEELALPGGDLWMSRTGGSTLYMLVGATLKKSVDFGVTFTTVSVVPASPDDAVRLVASEAGAPKFYAAMHTAGIWTLYTSNGGASWQSRGEMPDFWTFNACIGDSAQVLYGGVQCHRSTNGGGTFTTLNAWYDYYGDPVHKLHADIIGIHSLRVPPAGGGPLQEMIYISTDGGTYELGLASAVPTNLTQFGLRNAQYYSVRSSRAHPNVVSAGSQDQGYQATTAMPSFTQVISGDYGHLTGALATNDMVWSVYPGFLMLQTTESPAAVELPAPGNGFPTDSGIQWLPFILASPDDPAVVYFGARHLWRIRRTGAGVFTAEASLGDFDGGTGDNVGALAIAPGDHQRWYVATNQGRLWYSSNAGASWTESASLGPGSHYFYGSGLLVSPTNPLKAFVCGSGYSNPAVYVTTNGGATWSPYGSGLPQTLVFELDFDNPGSQTVYAASEAGPWRCVGGVWENLLTTTPGAALSTYWDVESLPGQGIVRYATYGRGIWDFHTGSTTAVEGRARSSLRLAISPNLSRGEARFNYVLERAGELRIDLFDVHGRRVATLLDGRRPAGAGSVSFDGRGEDGRALESGIYLARATSAGERAVQKLILAR